jgi:hypothetical protein
MTCEILNQTDLPVFHREYYLRNRPVIIRGLSDRYSARIFQWSAGHLIGEIGDQTVPVMTTRSGFLSYERNFAHMPFRDFAARMFASDPETGLRYYYKNPTSNLPAGVEDAECITDLAAYISKSVARNLWISSSGLTVGLHFDPADNLNFQLRGSKSFALYPPGVRPYYPLPMLSQTAHISGVFRDGPRLDPERFPRFRPDTVIRVTLQEGDVLYLPAYWWHMVESLGHENVNLNFWWLPRVAKQLANPNQALRGHVQVLLRLVRYGNIQQAPADRS